MAATESVLTWLVGERVPSERVRVDMIPSLTITAGTLGEAFAPTLVQGVPEVAGGRRFQGRRIVEGRLAPAPVGDEVTNALMPTGESLAAQHASQARFVGAG